MSIVWELETISTSDMSRMTSKICNMIFVFVYSNFFADFLILYVKRLGYAAKTAVLQVLFEILMAADRGDLAALVLLDLTAAFDTVDHDILLQRLKASFGINGIGIALGWFQSYLVGRSQYVRRGDAKSTIVVLICGVNATGVSLGPHIVHHVH